MSFLALQRRGLLGLICEMAQPLKPYGHAVNIRLYVRRTKLLYGYTGSSWTSNHTSNAPKAAPDAVAVPVTSTVG